MKSALFTILYLIALLSGTSSLAQNPEWLVYTDGNTITCFEDDGTHLWIGTEGGLVKRDKSTGYTERYNRVNSGMPDNWVMDIALDAQGNKWIATNSGGLVKFDGTNWTVFNTGNSGIAQDALRSVAIDTSGNVWAGTKWKGISIYDGSSWITYDESNTPLLSDHIFAITIDQYNVAWIGAGGEGMYRFDGTTWTHYSYGANYLPGEYVNCITIDENNVKWIGTEGGLAKYDDVSFTQYTRWNSGICYGDVTCVEESSDGFLWIGTSGGLSTFDGTNWEGYHSYDFGTETEHITALDVEGEEVLLGIYRGEMVKYDDGWNWVIVPFEFNGPFSNVVHDVDFDAQGNPWFAGNAALMHFDGVTWTNYTPFNSIMPNVRVEDIEIADNGVIWLGTFEGGMLRFENGNFTKYTIYNSPLPSNSIRSLQLDRNGVVWIGTSEEQICSFDGVNWTIFEPAVTGVPDNDEVWSLDIDENNVKWFGTYFSGRLIRYDGVSWTSYESGEDYLNFLSFDDNGTLWCALGSGLMTFENGNFSTVPAGYGTGDKVYIDFDLNGDVWVASFLSGAVKLHNGTWTVYNQSNSLISSQYTRCSVIDPKGNKWFGFSVYDGTSVYNENGVMVTAKEAPLPQTTALPVYPNPATDYFFIPESIEKNLVRVQIINIQGIILYNRPYSTLQKAINISSLPAGIYICRMICENGENSVKIIVE